MISQGAQIGNIHMAALSRATSASHLGTPVLSILGATSTLFCPSCLSAHSPVPHPPKSLSILAFSSLS